MDYGETVPFTEIMKNVEQRDRFGGGGGGVEELNQELTLGHTKLIKSVNIQIVPNGQLDTQVWSSGDRTALWVSIRQLSRYI